MVFPKGSKLSQDMSTQIEQLREGRMLLAMERDWFHEDTTNDPHTTLNLDNFSGLFLVSGVSSALALFLFTLFSLKDNWNEIKKCIHRKYPMETNKSNIRHKWWFCNAKVVSWVETE